MRGQRLFGTFSKKSSVLVATYLRIVMLDVDGGCQLFLKKSQKMKIPASSFRALGEATAAPGGLYLSFI